MRAAVVEAFGAPPRYIEFSLPAPTRGEIQVEVLAAGLHPRVRSGASGTHYSSDGLLPLIPGVDGVGRLPSGDRVFFMTLNTSMGSMADRAVVDSARCVLIPPTLDDTLVAAAMNPAMSSWLALRARTILQPGQNVLVHSATGNAGQMAVQIAKRLGAGRVIATGRDPIRLNLLADLGADIIIALDQDHHALSRAIREAAHDVDVVLDYLWGAPTELAMSSIAEARAVKCDRLEWVQIGASAGRELVLPAALLRATNICLIGSGHGAISVDHIMTEMPSLLDFMVHADLSVQTRRFPLSEVESTWNLVTGQDRIVYFP